jgi:small subunit ribosomal protein S18
MARKANKPEPRQRRRRNEQSQRRVKKKVCHFCQEKVEYIDFKDVSVLRRYMSDRAKIRARRVTGNCPYHQREVANAIKNAREMALLPYVGTGR